MKRWLLAGAALLGWTVGLAHADYVVIIANLSGAKTGPGGMGQPGSGPMGGGGYGSGGYGSGGQRQPGGPMGPMGGGGRGYGAGGQQQPGGGGFGPMGPGSGGFGPMGPGGMGPGGGGFGPMAPGGGGFGPMGPGGLGGVGGGEGSEGGFGGIGGAFVDNPLDPIYVVAVVETKTPVNNQFLLQKRTVTIDHKWGYSSLIQGDSPQISLRAIPIVENGRALSLAKLYEAKHKEVKATPTAEKFLEIAEWAMTHGLNKEFNTAMDEAVAAFKDHPGIKLVAQVRADLDKPTAEPKELGLWKEKLKLTKEAAKGHYVLLHNGQKNDTAETAAKVDRLEDTLRRYYLWFAFRGKALPLPQQKLIAVHSTKDEEFAKQHQAFDSLPLVSDGFVARRENLVVFAPTRLDQQYSDLMVFLKPAMAQFPDPAPFFKGKGEAATQTLLLLRKALEDDADVSTASREGARQLLASSGILPRNVAVPEWAQFGTAGFFETPKGSPWAGTATAGTSLMENSNYLALYKKWVGDKKREKPEVAFQKVVSDSYFRQIPFQKEEETEEDFAKRLAAVKQARTLSWSVTYFLAHRKLDNLLRYFQELSNLPRDLEFDEDVLMAAFGRAFDLTDGKDASKVNTAKFNALAREWDNYMRDTPLELDPILKQIEQVKKEMKAAVVNPPAGGAGGFGPMGGGFGPMGPGGGVP